MKRTTKASIAALLAAVTVLSACGNGGTGTSEPSAQATTTAAANAQADEAQTTTTTAEETAAEETEETTTTEAETAAPEYPINIELGDSVKALMAYPLDNGGIIVAGNGAYEVFNTVGESVGSGSFNGFPSLISRLTDDRYLVYGREQQIVIDSQGNKINGDDGGVYSYTSECLICMTDSHGLKVYDINGDLKAELNNYAEDLSLGWTPDRFIAVSGSDLVFVHATGNTALWNTSTNEVTDLADLFADTDHSYDLIFFSQMTASGISFYGWNESSYTSSVNIISPDYSTVETIIPDVSGCSKLGEMLVKSDGTTWTFCDYDGSELFTVGADELRAETDFASPSYGYISYATDDGFKVLDKSGDTVFEYTGDIVAIRDIAAYDVAIYSYNPTNGMYFVGGGDSFTGYNADGEAMYVLSNTYMD